LGRRDRAFESRHSHIFDSKELVIFRTKY